MNEEKVFLTKEDKIEGVVNIVRDILSAGDVTISVNEERCLNDKGNVTKVWQGIQLAATKVSTPKLKRMTLLERSTPELHFMIPENEVEDLKAYFNDYNDLVERESGERPFVIIDEDSPYQGGYTHENKEEGMEYTE